MNFKKIVDTTFKFSFRVKAVPRTMYINNANVGTKQSNRLKVR